MSEQHVGVIDLVVYQITLNSRPGEVQGDKIS